MGRNPLRLLVAAAALSTVVLAAGCAFVPRGFALTAISDITSGLLMLCAFFAFAVNARASQGRMRWFWALQAAGWGMWFCDQLVWITYELIWKQKMPPMHPADALLFLAGAPMFAGILLRPHLQPSGRSARLGFPDFLLLMIWWIYLYVSLVVCWQYVARDEVIYNRNFDLLATAENGLLTVIAAVFAWQSSGRWKRFYRFFCGAMAFNAIAFYAINRALENGNYFTGSWYDIPYDGSFAAFVIVALMGEGLAPAQESETGDSYIGWLGNFAMVAMLSLPIMAFYALLNPNLPHAVAHFRALAALATMFVMGLLLFIQHHRLNRELQRTNQVLHEASLTDPLTGLRNRRYFSATIEKDVSQTLRAYTDQHDPHFRDLVFYLIDADDFKEVNDRYGHDVGDKVLVEMSRRLSSSIRHSDVMVRWGGEEFLLISRYTDRREGELLAQRVLAAVAGRPFSLDAPEESIYRTCSIGWAAFPWFPENPRAVSYEEVLTLADRALNRAKQSGKNRAVGMLPASGKLASTSVEGLHSNHVQVDMLAVSGPLAP